MKVNKTQGAMFILTMLLEKGQIDKRYITNELDISDLTFKRYMQEIRAFLVNFNIPIEVKYSRNQGIYHIKK